MPKCPGFRFAFAAVTISLCSSFAFAQQDAPPKPPQGIDLDAAPSEGATPDPLTPPEANGPAPLAPGAPQAAPPAPAPEAAADPLREELRAKLSHLETGRGENREDVAGLVAFYTEGGGKPIWTGEDGFTARAKDAIAEIRKADDYGLEASAFDLPDLPAAKPSEAALADAEVKLSLAVLKYARFARGGRLDPAAISPIIDRNPKIFDPKSVLQGIAAADKADTYLVDLHPKHPQFERLREALLALKTAGPDAPEVRIPNGPNIAPGEENAQVALVRQRLKLTAAAGEETHYDGRLADAVKSWQKSHDLAATGVIDKKLRASLNEAGGDTAAEKRRRIIANMERWRWMPDDLGEIYVWDSVPEQVTRVFDHGNAVLKEKIVVGKPSTPTPLFSANMQFVIFHPEWGVPDSIKAKELGPRLRRYSGGFGGASDFPFFGGFGNGSGQALEAMGMRVSINGRQVDPDSVDWANVDIRRYQFIQAAGGRNVLGVVKFRFPNKHDVYMHDTPEKNLFNAATRAFSHGCMRTQNPVHLAEVLLARDKGWSAEKVHELVAQGGTDEITLTTPIPVHVTYFTVDVDDDGTVNYHPDIYGLDRVVTAALEGHPIPVSTQPGAEAASEDSENHPSRRPKTRQVSKPFDPFGMFGN